jgi:hypothetical protein
MSIVMSVVQLKLLRVSVRVQLASCISASRERTVASLLSVVVFISATDVNA